LHRLICFPAHNLSGVIHSNQKPGFPQFFLRVNIEARIKNFYMHAASHASPILPVPLMTASFIYLVPHLFQASICQIKSTAMKLSATIKTFMQTNQDVYPYSDVPCTRSGYYPKWLLVSSRYKQGQIWRQDGYHVIKSSCLSHANVQNLIMSGDALPLPAVFGEVVDALETWGAKHWTWWLQKSLKLFHEHLKEDNVCGGVAPCKMRVFHDCIFLCVEREARSCFMTNTANYNLVLRNWNTCFWVKCWEEPFFWETTCSSMRHVEGVIESIQRATTVVTVVTPHVANINTT